jgi:hypothetical protein
MYVMVPILKLVRTATATATTLKFVSLPLRDQTSARVLTASWVTTAKLISMNAHTMTHAGCLNRKVSDLKVRQSLIARDHRLTN